MTVTQQTPDSKSLADTELGRFPLIPQALRYFLLFLYSAALILYLIKLFNVSVGGWVIYDVRYYYIVYLAFASGVFLVLPARKKDRGRIPWYDYICFAVMFCIFAYLAAKAHSIGNDGGMWIPPRRTYDLVFTCILAVLSLESGRRLAGWPLIIICLLFGIYPIFADRMPGILYGFSFSFTEVVGSFAFSKSGLLGLPVQVVGNTLLAFLIFAGFLLASGAAEFFLNLAMAIFGRFRGGPAKVAVVASGFFGSLTGSTTANIVGTGAVTIPAMKRLGYQAHYAGAIEAAASTGGIIMPPVMGTIAFIMAILTGLPYSQIVIAAIIPALLYYLGLLAQVDSYAARVGLRGMPREEIPSLWKTLKNGWVYLITLIFLVVGLIYFRWNAEAAIYSSALLFILSFTRRETMMTPRKLIQVVLTIGRLVLFVLAVLMPVGLLLVGVDMTGSMAYLTTELMSLAGSNPIMILLLAALVCYIFGMVGLAFVPYIVLAVTAIPGLQAGTGMSLMALHLFVVYYLIMSGITPPVAYAAFVAAAMAGSSPMKTAWTSLRMGIVLVFVPFFFVLNPALIFEGPLIETLYLFLLCIIGIWILGSGLEGYLIKIGRLSWWPRILLVVGGFLIAMPTWITTYYGFGLCLLTIVTIMALKRRFGKLVKS